MTRSTALPFLLLAIPQAVTALEVSPGSPCATHCLDSPSGNEWEASASNTFTEDIICHDDDYFLTAQGKKFRQCVNCLQTNAAGHEQETDLDWFIYNLRYAVSTCVFSKPKQALLGNDEPPCNTDSTCGLLNHALTGDGPSPNITTTRDYCGADDGRFLGSQLQPCISCLRNSKDQTYLANFMTALKASCMQGPDVATLELSGQLFATDPVNITDRSEPDESRPSHRHRHLALVAVIGIGVGVVLIFSLAILLLLIYYVQRNTSCSPEHFCSHGDMADPHKTPWYHIFTRARRLVGCRRAKKKGPKEGPPPTETNGDYYNRMEEATQDGGLKYVHDPRLANRGPDNVMLTHQAYKVNTHISRTDEAGTSPGLPPSIAPFRKQQGPQAPDPYIEQAYRDSVQEALRISKPESTHARSPPASSLRSFKPESIPARSPPASSLRSFRPESTNTRSPPATYSPCSPPLSTSRSTSGLECSSPESLSSPAKSSTSRRSKRFIPSLLKLRPGSSTEESGDHQIRISPPIMRYDARFDESVSPPSPPQRVEVMQQHEDDEAASRKTKKRNLYIEVPIQNTENDLF